MLRVEARMIDMRRLLGLHQAHATSAPIQAKPQEDVLAVNGGWLEVCLTMESGQDVHTQHVLSLLIHGWTPVISGWLLGTWKNIICRWSLCAQVVSTWNSSTSTQS